MKKLKLWSGHGWGRRQYDSNTKIIEDPTGRKYCDGSFICAHSAREACLIMSLIGRHISPFVLNKYWHKMEIGEYRGVSMKEMGIWTVQNFNDKPKRIYPEGKEKNERKINKKPNKRSNNRSRRKNSKNKIRCGK